MAEPVQSTPILGSHPPRPRLAFRVVAVGHRPERLPEPADVRDALARVLGHVGTAVAQVAASTGAYSPDPPLVRLLTGAAEGTDRIAAAVALELGFDLQLVLPFPREVYARDFVHPGDEPATQASLAEFESLLADKRVSAVVELDGVALLSHAADIGTADTKRAAAELAAAGVTPETATPPYAALADVLARQCDLLVAVWDGQAARGPGGTGNIVRETRARGIPVVVISPDGDTVRLLAENQQRYDDAALASLIGSGLLPPAGEPGERMSLYLRERRPGWRSGSIAPEWLRNRSLLNWAWPAFRNVASASLTRRPAPARRSSGAQPAPQQPYAWADLLARYYADRHRSAFVVIYLLGLVTVVLGVLARTHPDLIHVGRVDLRLWLTLVVLSTVVGIWFVGSHVKGWHRRWLDYRLLAEYLRQLEFLAPLAATSPRVRLPPHRAPGDPGNSWMAWYARALSRDAGLVSTRFDQSTLESARDALRQQWVGSQLAYHRENAERYTRIERRLHWAGLVAFVFAFVAVVVTIFEESELLITLETILPALASAFGAIAGQAELGRIAQRSEGIAAWLGEMDAKLASASTLPGVSASRDLRLDAESVATVMLDELLDWRVVFESRPLSLPA